MKKKRNTTLNSISKTLQHNVHYTEHTSHTTQPKTHNSKGITLVALVVTIVVLIILAGISISMLTGENGILQKVSKAKYKTEKSVDLEKIQLAAQSAYIIELGKVTKVQLAQELGIDESEITEKNGSFLYVCNNTNYYITSDGIVSTSIIPYEFLKVGESIKYEGAETTEIEEKRKIASDEWQIYYVDNEKKQVYITLKNISMSTANIPIAPKDKLIQYKGTEDFRDISLQDERFKAIKDGLGDAMKNLTDSNDSNELCVRATEYLLDSTNWESYQNRYAQYVIGCPTAELLNKSLIQESSQKNDLNCKLTDSSIIWNPNAKVHPGYTLRFDGNFNNKSISYLNEYYWIASPLAHEASSYALNILATALAFRNNDDLAVGKTGFRPIVCLNANIPIYLDNNGGYLLSQ